MKKILALSLGILCGLGEEACGLNVGNLPEFATPQLDPQIKVQQRGSYQWTGPGPMSVLLQLDVMSVDLEKLDAENASAVLKALVGKNIESIDLWCSVYNTNSIRYLTEIVKESHLKYLSGGLTRRVIDNRKETLLPFWEAVISSKTLKHVDLNVEGWFGRENGIARFKTAIDHIENTEEWLGCKNWLDQFGTTINHIWQCNQRNPESISNEERKKIEQEREEYKDQARAQLRELFGITEEEYCDICCAEGYTEEDIDELPAVIDPDPVIDVKVNDNDDWQCGVMSRILTSSVSAVKEYPCSNTDRSKSLLKRLFNCENTRYLDFMPSRFDTNIINYFSELIGTLPLQQIWVRENCCMVNALHQRLFVRMAEQKLKAGNVDFESPQYKEPELYSALETRYEEMCDDEPAAKKRRTL